MKAAFSIIFLFLLPACSDDNNQPPAKSDAALRRDSVPFHKKAINPYMPVDLSPMDISYFPTDYPVAKMSARVQGPPKVRVIYSRPYRQGRKVFGQLLKYGEPWRLGANEATEIEFFSPATIQGTRVAAGRYVIYCVPEADKWTLRFNTNLFTWGLKQNPGKDVHAFEIPVSPVQPPVEYFTLVFRETATGADMIMAWDDVEARLPISF